MQTTVYFLGVTSKVAKKRGFVFVNDDALRWPSNHHPLHARARSAVSPVFLLLILVTIATKSDINFFTVSCER